MNEDNQTNIWRGPQKFNTTQIVNCLIRKSQYKEDEDAEEVGKFSQNLHCDDYQRILSPQLF